MRRTHFLFMAALVLLLICMTVSCLAQPATVQGGYLRLRSAPSYGAPVIDRYPTGTYVNILSVWGGFALVVTPDGRTGYMDSHYLAPAVIPSVLTTPSMLSSGFWPAGGYLPPAYMSYTPYIPTGYSPYVLPTYAASYCAYRPAAAPGAMASADGWMAVSRSGVVASPNGRPVRFRKTPVITEGNIIGLCSAGTELTVTAMHSSGWSSVRVGQTVGYMRSSYITLYTEPAHMQTGSMQVFTPPVW